MIKNQDFLIINDIGALLTLSGAAKKKGQRISENDLGIIKNAAMVLEKGRISWVGPATELPQDFAQRKFKEISAQNKTVLPGFVECHTHLVFGGDRSSEFELRNQGMSYSQIAAQGGGILSTVRATREISHEDLRVISQKRVNHFAKQGVTTLEIKSGYGLSLEAELKQLEVALCLQGPKVITTFLGAHAKPAEFETYEQYLTEVLQVYLPEIKKRNLSQRVDIFVEHGFFSAEMADRYLKAAQEMGFKITIHADQLSLSGGADLAAKLGAQSADHLICVSNLEIAKLKKADTTAVLLPTADFYLKCAYPPARKIIDAGVTVALATDFNPGTSPTQDLAFVGMLARIEMKMTLPEVISAYTVGASRALGLLGEIGSLEVGKKADFIFVESEWSELFYKIGDLDVSQTFVSGEALN